MVGILQIRIREFHQSTIEYGFRSLLVVLERLEYLSFNRYSDINSGLFHF
jgi:hypothetical protein